MTRGSSRRPPTSISRLGLYGNNLTDKRYKTEGQEFSSVGTIRTAITVPRGRSRCDSRRDTDRRACRARDSRSDGGLRMTASTFSPRLFRRKRRKPGYPPFASMA